nr:uncharacterized protein LOC108016566 isoform X3 [Drosophila suzukii]XP_036676659.1 uncharacterized protein LOC108016566 isoform X3 [Drosophila suzukii]
MNFSETMDEKRTLREIMEESLIPENRHVTRTRKVVKSAKLQKMTARPSPGASRYKQSIAHLKASSLSKKRCLQYKGKYEPQQAEDVWANTSWFQGAQCQEAVPPTEDAKTLQWAFNQPAVPQTQHSWFQGAQTQGAAPQHSLFHVAHNQPRTEDSSFQEAPCQPAVPQMQHSWFQGVQTQAAVPPTQDSVPQPQHSWFQGAHNQPEGPRTLDSWFQRDQTQEAVPQAQVPWFQGAHSQGAAPTPQHSLFQVAHIQPAGPRSLHYQGFPEL